MRVAIIDHVFPSISIEEEVFKEFGIELKVTQLKDENDIIAFTKGVQGILVCYSEITRRIIDSLDDCKIIARYGIGVDNVDIKAATEKGIIVTNVPDYCIDEVSDHALAFLLALTRKLVALDFNVQSGIWDFKDQRPFPRLRGKVLGLVGFGKVARALCEKVKPLGINVITYDPYLQPKEAEKHGALFVNWNDLLKLSDFISIHCPLVPETKELFDEKAFSAMKRTAILVNTARGEIVNEKALVSALNNNKIMGAGLDVYGSSNDTPVYPLLNQKNLILTPHAAFYSEESVCELQRKAAEQVLAVLKKQRPKYVVNKDVFNK